MKKTFFFLVVLVFSFSVLIALPSSRTGNDTEVNSAPYTGEIYSGKAGVVLYVEDPGQPGFGPANKPDSAWILWLNSTLGSGNYDWWGPIVDTGDGPPVDTMLLYDLVIWNCYDWWWSVSNPTVPAINNMQSYLDQGGKVWFIGQDANYSAGTPFTTLMQNHFGVATITNDYAWDPPIINAQGQAELSGRDWSSSTDNTNNYFGYQANNFFPDDITCSSAGHIIVYDVDSLGHPACITNDYHSSFWAFDGGRIAAPQAVWIDVVDTMLTLFGVLNAVEETPVNIGSGFVVREINSFTSNPGIYLSTSEVVNLKVEIFDVTGRSCAVLFDGSFQGERVFSYSNTSSGTYIYRITANESVMTGKLISAY